MLESRELNLLTTIVDLGGTHRFTNCRSSRPSCSVALPFDLSWKVHQILNIDFSPFFFFRCNGASILALCDKMERTEMLRNYVIISPFSRVKISSSLKEKSRRTKPFRKRRESRQLISLIEIAPPFSQEKQSRRKTFEPTFHINTLIIIGE